MVLFLIGFIMADYNLVSQLEYLSRNLDFNGIKTLFESLSYKARYNLVNKPLDFKLWTTMHYATLAMNIEWIKYLICLGADILKQDASGNTPFHIMKLHGDPIQVDMVRCNKYPSINLKREIYQLYMNHAELNGGIYHKWMKMENNHGLTVEDVVRSENLAKVLPHVKSLE